jgi:hypothetical protein
MSEEDRAVIAARDALAMLDEQPDAGERLGILTHAFRAAEKRGPGAVAYYYALGESDRLRRERDEARAALAELRSSITACDVTGSHGNVARVLDALAAHTGSETRANTIGDVWKFGFGTSAEHVVEGVDNDRIRFRGAKTWAPVAEWERMGFMRVRCADDGGRP